MLHRKGPHGEMSIPDKPQTVAAYLAALPVDQRETLERLRGFVREVAPEAEECLSYGASAFRHGRMLVGYGATARHCAFYLMSSTLVATHGDLLAAYDTSAGTIRFAADSPLPKTLVRMLVKARLAENAALDAKQASGRPARRAEPKKRPLA